MNILVTGSNGQLGKEAVIQCREKGYFVTGLSHTQLDICNLNSINEAFERFSPNVVINCASYTQVDNCEDEENYKIAYAVNVEGAKNIAVACENFGSKLIHISTDYVFDYIEREPIKESQTPNPINKYGETKYQSEMVVQKECSKCFVIRTSWLYGDGKNFVRTMLKLSQNSDVLKVVDDQVGTPTSTNDLMHVIIELMQTDYYGLYHGTNHGQCSWYDFSVEIFKIKEIPVKVIPVSSEEFISRARRPAYSVLDNYQLRKVGLDSFGSWQEALKYYLMNE